MEFLIVFALLAVIMLCIGFGIADILMLAVLIIAVLTVLIGIFFLICLSFLLFSKKKSGEFTGFNEDGRFPRAVYKVDGEEILNVFPCEMVMRKKLYVPEKTVTLYYIKPRRAVADKNAFVTIIAGGAVFIPLAVAAMILIIREVSAFFVQ